MVFVTLKMPKSLINNEMRAARPGGSKPPPSLGVRPRLAQKVVEGVFCCSESVRATKRRRRIFSLGRCRVSDRGERNREARARTEKVVEEAICCSVRVRATKRRRRIFSLGRCRVSDRGERNREARARTEKVVEEAICCSVRVRATKRQRRIFSLGRCHEVTEG